MTLKALLSSHLLLAVAAALLAACGPGTVERASLRDVPRPDLAPLSESVRSQLEAERAALDEALEDSAIGRREMAERFGRMGRHYHAYGIEEPALDCYANAEALDASGGEWPYLAAVIHQERGETDEAAAAFTRALDRDAESQAALLRLAELRLDQNRPAEAEELLERVLALDPDAAAAHHLLGRIASARDDFTAAVRHFERALELQPAASSVHYLLAQAYRRLGDAAAAEGHLALMDAGGVAFPDPYLEAVKALPGGAGTLSERAIAALGEGRAEDAIAFYRQAMAEDPENLTAMRGLGLALRTAGRLEEAEAAYRSMIERHPAHPLARLELATVLMEQNALDEAIEEFRQALVLDPEFKQAHFNMAVALVRTGRLDEAARSFQKVLEIDDKDHEARYQLAIVMDELERPEDAFALLTRVAAEDPTNVKARQRLGYYLAERGDLDRAAGEHRAVVALEGAPDQEKALAHYQLGRIAGRQGRTGSALEHFQAAVELFPELWAARIGLANSLRDLGRVGEAETAFRQVVERDPANVLARVGEAESMILGGRFEAARERLEEGLAALPKSAELGHLLARLLATAPEAEVRDGDRALELASQIFQAIPSIEHAETVIMAMAELGRFDEAVAWQEKIIVRAENEGLTDGELDRLRRNLARYRRHEPARTS